MVGRRKRLIRAPHLLGNHQRCWLWGRHAVLETLRAGRWTPLEVHYDPAIVPPDAAAEIQQLAAVQRIPLETGTAANLSQQCGSREHQGLMARMPPFPYAPLETAMERCLPGTLSLILAGIQDPFNFGSILRSADLFEAAAVFVPERGQSDVTAHVVRSSVGAVNHLNIARAPSLTSLCEQLRTRGVRIAAASAAAPVDAADANLAGAVALIIGNEGGGIDPGLLAAADVQLRIPHKGHVGSLNAAVAAGILCYEVRRQRARSADSSAAD